MQLWVLAVMNILAESCFATLPNFDSLMGNPFSFLFWSKFCREGTPLKEQL